MNTEIKSNYVKFRLAGYHPCDALRAAKTLNQWEDHSETVRLRLEPEQESYFSVYGEPDGYTDGHGRKFTKEQEKAQIIDTIEAHGCWCVIAEYFDGEQWQMADPIGMCTGYKNPLSPFQNGYVPDLMRSALKAIENSAVAPNL